MVSRQRSSNNRKLLFRMCVLLAFALALASCGGGSSDPDPGPIINPDDNPEDNGEENPAPEDPDENEEEVEPLILSLDPLFEYANQPVPTYITKDNGTENPITDIGATLGRVLFYDVRLSSNDAISCASCHHQSLGFSDDDLVSVGVNGLTERHSMRLTNLRFGQEQRFFWNERAESLEDQSTQPIHDHVEMGFSGEDGDPGFDDLINKLEATNYYPLLFTAAYGNAVITEERMQQAMSQFMRSMQSFDTRFDQQRANANDDVSTFAGFTDQENEGKRLFLEQGVFIDSVRQAGTGLGCNQCHRAPEFDIDPDSRNNGIVSVANNLIDTDIANIRSPSLRGLFDQDGNEIGPFMHDGSLSSLTEVLDHYNDITADIQDNANLDGRLQGSTNRNDSGPGQKLQLTASEKLAVIAFLKTLSGSAIYTDEKFSDPFDENGLLQDVLSRP